MAELSESEVHPNKTSLFKAPFYKDWTVMLGLLAVGAAAVSRAQDYPPLWSADSFDRSSQLFDIAFGLCVQLGFFCFLPAAIRDRKSKWWAAQTHKPLRARWVWLLGVLVAAGSAGVGGLTGQSATSSELASPECFPQEDGTQCVQVLSDDGRRTATQWDYFYTEPQLVEGKSVASFSFRLESDCEQGTAEVVDLRAVGPSGQLVAVSAALLASWSTTLEATFEPSVTSC